MENIVDNKEIYRLHADFCKFMGNAKRIEIMFVLGNSEKCVEDIAKIMGINIPNVSQHLAIMKEKGVVEVRRDGVKMFYKISNPRTLEACIIMRDLMIEQCNKRSELIKKIRKTGDADYEI